MYVERKIFSSFVEGLKRKAESLNPGWPNHEQTDLGPLISAQHRDKVLSYYRLAQEEGAHLITGGGIPKFSDNRNHGFYVQPTIYTGLPESARCVKEEIFGPLLPVISYDNTEEAMEIVQRNSGPLAFYLFTDSKRIETEWIEKISFGGGCINNTDWHFTNYYLPFGGVGNSGIGAYHGKYTFDTFTRAKPIMKTPTWFDPSIKYPPFKGKLGLFKKIIR